MKLTSSTQSVITVIPKIKKSVMTSKTWVVHHNQPVMISVFKDPETLADRVCVVVSLPSGVTDVTFGLIGTGPATWKERFHTDGQTLCLTSKACLKLNWKKRKCPKSCLWCRRWRTTEEISKMNQEALNTFLSRYQSRKKWKYSFKAGKITEGVLVVCA